MIAWFEGLGIVGRWLLALGATVLSLGIAGALGLLWWVFLDDEPTPRPGVPDGDGGDDESDGDDTDEAA